MTLAMLYCYVVSAAAFPAVAEIGTVRRDQWSTQLWRSSPHFNT